MYQGHSAEATHQERTDIAVPRFLSTYPQPEDWPSVTARVSGILHLHEPDGEVPGGV